MKNFIYVNSNTIFKTKNILNLLKNIIRHFKKFIKLKIIFHIIQGVPKLTQDLNLPPFVQ